MNDTPPARELLRRLPQPMREVWLDDGVRASHVDAIHGAWQRGDGSQQTLLEAFDTAVSVGLDALDLPRGPVRAVLLEETPPLMSARKRAICDLVIGTRYLKQIAVSRRSEALLATWIHESLHARQRYAPNAQDEIRGFVGYEEGMVEGLTRTICASHAGIAVTTGSYDSYVACYESLARTTGVPPELLYRELWQYPPGTLRTHFFDALRDVLYNSHSDIGVTADRRNDVMDAADALFDNNAQLLPQTAAIDFDLYWKQVLR